MVATGMNPFINAQGYATTGMTSVIIGAVANLLLDPLFIFVFGLGIKGAAIATVISQTLSAAFVLYFLHYKAEYRIRFLSKTELAACGEDAKNIVSLGTAGFIMQLTNSLVTICANNVLSVTGGDVYISVMTIISSVRQMVETPIYAITEGSSPIISYNYGTGNAARVHETFRLSLKTAFISGLTAFAVMYVFCPYIVAMFLEPGCPAYGIATKGIPYFASGFICFALNIAWIGYYQSIELARKAMLFMLLRGIILMSICFLALPHLLGEKGLWAAVPCAELIIFIALTIDYQYRHKICRVVK